MARSTYSAPVTDMVHRGVLGNEGKDLVSDLQLKRNEQCEEHKQLNHEDEKDLNNIIAHSC